MRKWVTLPAISVLAAVLTLSGCFRYVPVDVGAFPPGGEVRVELTRVGFAQLPELPNLTGPDLNGTLVRREQNRLFLSVPVNVRLDGIVTQTVQQELAIPTTDIVQMERRVLSRGRTGLTIGSGIVTLGVIFLSFHDSGDENPELPERRPEEEAGVGFGRPSGRISIPIR